MKAYTVIKRFTLNFILPGFYEFHNIRMTLLEDNYLLNYTFNVYQHILR